MPNSISSRIPLHNKLRAMTIYILRTVALLCATGPLMQTFLSSIGFTEQQIYIHATVFQAVNVVTILLCSRFADTPRLLRRAALVQFPGALLFLCYLPLCIAANVSTATYFWLLLVSVMQSVAFALHTVCEYKLPYYIYYVHEYGNVMAICGILSSIASFGVGSLMSALSLRYDYPRLMTAAFALSCVFLLSGGILQAFQKSLLPSGEEAENRQQKEKIPLVQIFRHEAFSHLLTGNFTRGIASGTTTILATAALSIGYDEVLTTVMVSVQSVASLAACMLFAVISRRLHPRHVILGGSLCFLVLPAMLIPGRPILFLICYGILLVGRTLVDYAIPAALLYAVPLEIAGTYNAWRMIVLNAGTMLSTMAAGFLPLPLLFWITLVCQLITGVNYFCVRVMRNKTGIA